MGTYFRPIRSFLKYVKNQPFNGTVHRTLWVCSMGRVILEVAFASFFCIFAVVGRSFRHWRHYEILNCCVLIARRLTVRLFEGTDFWAEVFSKVGWNGVYLDWRFWVSDKKICVLFFSKGYTLKTKIVQPKQLCCKTKQHVPPPPTRPFFALVCRRVFPKSSINPDLGQFPLRERVHSSKTNPWSRPRSSSLLSRQAYFG